MIFRCKPLFNCSFTKSPKAPSFFIYFLKFPKVQPEEWHCHDDPDFTPCSSWHTVLACMVELIQHDLNAILNVTETFFFLCFILGVTVRNNFLLCQLLKHIHNGMFYKPPYLQIVWYLTPDLFSLTFRYLQCFPKWLYFIYLIKLQHSVPVTSSPDYLTNLYHRVDFYVVLSVFSWPVQKIWNIVFWQIMISGCLFSRSRGCLKANFFFSTHMADLLQHVGNCSQFCEIRTG